MSLNVGFRKISEIVKVTSSSSSRPGLAPGDGNIPDFPDDQSTRHSASGSNGFFVTRVLATRGADVMLQDPLGDSYGRVGTVTTVG